MRARIEKDAASIIEAMIEAAKAGDLQAGSMLLSRIEPGRSYYLLGEVKKIPKQLKRFLGGSGWRGSPEKTSIPDCFT